MQNGHRPLGIRYAHANALDFIRHAALNIIRTENIGPENVVEVLGRISPGDYNGMREFILDTYVVYKNGQSQENGCGFTGASLKYKVVESGNAHIYMFLRGVSTGEWNEKAMFGTICEKPQYRLGKEHLTASPA
ncbi:MAG: hypothetical protein V1887_02590 [Candidatus Aenigmatarchaeota archaeon]